VDLTVTFGASAPAGCHQVTDILPSGLVPVGALEGREDPSDDDEPASSGGVVRPYAESGQRVFFCAEVPSQGRSVVLRTFARVVTTGTYAWEPAVAESRTDPDRAAMTGPTTIVIQ
jgi:uncharacterized protein YfaS (alpha-2-macroglobulin family)